MKITLQSQSLSKISAAWDTIWTRRRLYPHINKREEEERLKREEEARLEAEKKRLEAEEEKAQQEEKTTLDAKGDGSNSKTENSENESEEEGLVHPLDFDNNPRKAK